MRNPDIIRRTLASTRTYGNRTALRTGWLSLDRLHPCDIVLRLTAGSEKREQASSNFRVAEEDGLTMVWSAPKINYLSSTKASILRTGRRGTYLTK